MRKVTDKLELATIKANMLLEGFEDEMIEWAFENKVPYMSDDKVFWFNKEDDELLGGKNDNR